MNAGNAEKTVRTRFAPSPTGDLHIGGARTALFNFLFARKFPGGAFVLRIDDTDSERSRAEYERHLVEDLRWLGIDWDEGPDRGGPFAPYRQSERTAFYDEILKSLREMGAIYPCFCSEGRLEALRAEQAARGEPPRYDGLCRRLPPGEAERRAAPGEGEGGKPCWRFALPEEAIRFRDEVREEELSFAPGVMGDFVVARSDGRPTYLFTSVADDHLMEITHILRGDEHIPNTARQQAIFDRLGWKAPVYAHIPMILSGDRQKLSKRTGSTPIRRYREEGYLPEALAAYLSTLSWTPPEPRDFLSGAGFGFSSAAAAFSLGRISASPPVHDEAHLNYWQKEAMRKRGGGVILDWLKDSEREPEPPGQGSPILWTNNTGALARLTEDLIEEHHTLPLLREALEALFERPHRGPEDGPPLRGRLWLPDLERTLRAAGSWEEDELNRSLRAFMKERGLKGKEFFHPLRLALTGQESGAALPLVMSALGRDETLRRLFWEY